MPDAEVRAGVLRKADVDALEAIAKRNGWRTIRGEAASAVADGRTTPSEVDRVLGPRPEQTN